jgi:hypothetical protein
LRRSAVTLPESPFGETRALLKSREAADFLGITERQLRYLREHEELRAYRIANMRSIRYRREDLLRLLRAIK